MQLIRNLYENQGEMRFDASNRLFVILVDVNDFENSWKFKSNRALLRKYINSYLDNFNKAKVNQMKIIFNRKAKAREFSAVSDIIFIIQE